jgi:predicted permease
MTGDLGADFRLAARALRAAPAVTLAAVFTLALGIGACTAIFTVANALVLRPLPVRDPQQLVTITSGTALRHGFQSGAGWNYAMWDRLRQRADTFDGALAWTLQRLDLSEGGEMQPVEALLASGGFFHTLGVRAIAGRTFTQADDVRGGGQDGPVVVISHDLWQRRFNGATDIVGSRLSVEGTPMTIIGVAPQRFRGLDIGQLFDLAIPFGAEALIRGRRSLLDNERALLLTVMLRLKSGQTVPEATAALRTMQSQILGPEAPEFLKEPFMLVGASTGISDRSRLRQQYERPLVTLSIVAGLVLLIVCLNIANLFLARAAARRRELSLRLAVGAPWWRVVRQLLVEALTLGILGALGGVLFAGWASRGLVALVSNQGRPILMDLPVDWHVLAFTTGLTMISVVLFGMAPAASAARVSPVEALQDHARVSGGTRTGRLSNGLVLAQIALSIVLLAAAGLFIRTLNRLAAVPLGFDPKGVVVVTVNTARSRMPPAMRPDLHQRVIAAAGAVPGVARAAGSIWTPVGTGAGGLLIDARGRRADVGPQVAFNLVSPGWLATYGTALRTGRDFDARDAANAPPVALVNETLHRRLLRDVAVDGGTIDARACRGCTVIGVVADAVYGRSLRDDPPPTIYMPLAQSAGRAPPDAPIRVSVRAAADPARLIPGLTAALRAVDDSLTFTFRPLDLDISASVAQERLVATLAGFFGAIALLLSAVGLYGVTSYAVSRRRGEIGIRLALGGQPAAVVRGLLTRIALFVLAGTVTGLAAALWLSHFVAPLLYDLDPRDPLTFAASTATLVSVAAAAGWLPARRAARVDPAQVLREN